MQTEIYDEREIDSATLKPEGDSEALALIAELGLKMQANPSGSRIAYPKVTEDQAFVMSALFEKATVLDKYDAGSIPLRVLKEIQKYRKENPDHLLVVRHCTPAQVKDPVLLAYITPQKDMDKYADHYAQNGSWHEFRLIARWGDALDSWESMLVKAREVASVGFREGIEAIMAQCETAMAKLKRGLMPKTNRVPYAHNLEDI